MAELEDALLANVARVLNGISESDWERMDPAARVTLKKDAARFAAAVLVVHTILSCEEE